jgi:hypothetical protein
MNRLTPRRLLFQRTSWEIVKKQKSKRKLPVPVTTKKRYERKSRRNNKQYMKKNKDIEQANEMVFNINYRNAQYERWNYW